MDMLVRLYALPDASQWATAVRGQGITIRSPMSYERAWLINWVRDTFDDGEAWASELECALAHVPASCLIAARDEELLGFACYDATARGMFGPTGTAPHVRGKGIGAALLLETLDTMRRQGYAYAVVGAVGPNVQGFYEAVAGAKVIADSDPGPYVTPVRPSDAV